MGAPLCSADRYEARSRATVTTPDYRRGVGLAENETPTPGVLEPLLMQELGDVDGKESALGVETSTAPHRTAGAWLGEGGSSRTGSLLAPPGK